MNKVKIVVWLLAVILVQNWACRTDNIWVKVYHQRDLEPMGSFDGNSMDDENKGKYFISERGYWQRNPLNSNMPMDLFAHIPF